MLLDKRKPSMSPQLKAYISASKDRELNTFYIAAICDTERDVMLTELSNYHRKALEKEIEEKYPGIEIENE